MWDSLFRPSEAGNRCEREQRSRNARTDDFSVRYGQSGISVRVDFTSSPAGKVTHRLSVCLEPAQSNRFRLISRSSTKPQWWADGRVQMDLATRGETCARASADVERHSALCLRNCRTTISAARKQLPLVADWRNVEQLQFCRPSLGSFTSSVS